MTGVPDLWVFMVVLWGHHTCSFSVGIWQFTCLQSSPVTSFRINTACGTPSFAAPFHIHKQPNFKENNKVVVFFVKETKGPRAQKMVCQARLQNGLTGEINILVIAARLTWPRPLITRHGPNPYKSSLAVSYSDWGLVSSAFKLTLFAKLYSWLNTTSEMI